MNVFKSFRQNPVIAKELRSRMRGLRGYILLVCYLLVLSGFILGAYLLFRSSASNLNNIQERQSLGKVIFGMTFWLQLLTVAFIAPALTSGAIAGERERQTIDLLRVTLLSPIDLLNGKLFSALAFLLLLLIAGVPLQGLAFIFGGISAGELVASALLLVLTAILFSTVGLCASAIFKRTLPATVLSYGVALVMLFGIPVMLILMLIFMDTWLSNAPSSTELAVFLIGYSFVCLNPLSASLASELIIMESGSLWSITLPLSSTQVTVVSPWLPYAFISALTSLILILLAHSLLKKPER